MDDKRVSVITKQNDEGKFISTFTIDADYTKSVITSNKKLYSQFKENIKNGKRYIYFNNFFQSYRLDNGKETVLTSNMYDIDSIRNNQYWANKNEWDTGYFNIKVPYNVTSNVHVKLADANGNYLGEATGATNDWGFKLHNVMVGNTVKKNPYLAFYNKKYDAQGICDSKKKIYAGDEVTVALPETIVAGGKTYTLYRSYYYQTTDSKTKVDDTRLTSDKAGTVKKKLEVGLDCPMVVGRYKLKEDPPPDPPDPPGPPDPDKGETVEGEFTDADPYGVVQAGTLEQSDFDVLQGIPGTESLYTHVVAPKYLAGYVFTKKTGTKVYTARGSVTWNLSWIEGEGENAQPMTATQTVTYSAPVTRTYSYWEITSLDVYGLSNSTVENGAFPAGSVTMAAKNYAAPSVSYLHSSNEGDHIKQPDEIGQVLDLGTMSASSPSPPAYDATSQLEAKVGECKVKNDRLVFNGETVMDNAWNTKVTDRPGSIETEPGDVADKTLYETGLVIPGERANGIYGSSGDVVYSRVAAVGSTRESVLTVPIGDINDVTVHTPVVCKGYVEDERDWNQMLNPAAGYTSLILNTAFRISLPTAGEHRPIPGYGTRDYAKYTAARQVLIPFDIYKGTSFVPAGTWTDVAVDTVFYLPPWVTEGRYNISFRTIPINAYANNGFGLTEWNANLSVPNYVAVDSIPVEVSGRLYSFEVYDISDYPLWRSTFRDAYGYPTGFTYKVGQRNEFGQANGQGAKFTLPILDGSHPKYENAGAVKTGYVFRFKMKTIGDYDGKEDFIRIVPKFYYASPDGSGRQEVDVYYTERFETSGQRELLVRIGSERDRRNQHTVETGDPYMSLPAFDLETTARLKGTDLKHLKAQRKQVFSFQEMMIPDHLMAFTQTRLPVDISAAGKTEDDVAGHMQTWYGKYYLPKEIHVCPKGFDLQAWVEKHGSLDYTEGFWLRDSYLMVNFEIETVQDGERYLSYINAENAKNGYCNMWKLEGGVSKKADYSGSLFEVRDGDVLVYYTNKSIGDDYRSNGVY